MIEVLESRSMLAGDLAVDVISSTVTASLVTGSSAKGAIAIELTNLGTSTFDKISPKIDVQVKAFKVGSQDDAGVIVGVAKKVSIGNLATTAKKKLKISIKTPTSLAAGTYRFDVVADPTNQLGESDSSVTNNTESATNQLAVSAPFSLLSVDAVTYKFKSSVSGSKGTGSATIKNAGNVLTKGLVDVTFVAVPDTSSAISEQVTIGTVKNAKVNLKTNKSGVIAKNVKITLPANGAISSKNYSIVARISNVRVTPVDNGSDAQRLKAASVKISLPAVPRTDAEPLLPGIGKRLAFTVTQILGGGDIIEGLNTETGNVVDELGRAGQYDFVFVPALNGAAQSVTLTLVFPATATQGAVTLKYSVTYVGDTFNSLDKKTLAFGVSGTAAKGSVKSEAADPGVNFALA